VASISLLFFCPFLFFRTASGWLLGRPSFLAEAPPHLPGPSLLGGSAPLPSTHSQWKQFLTTLSFPEVVDACSVEVSKHFSKRGSDTPGRTFFPGICAMSKGEPLQFHNSPSYKGVALLPSEAPREGITIFPQGPPPQAWRPVPLPGFRPLSVRPLYTNA